jgi:RNA polymerase sigma-70 factor (ECF subfamily)
MDDVTMLLKSEPERALDQMLRAYTGLVYHAAAAILGRNYHEEIEECVSDAFLAVYNNRDRLDFSQGSVKAYLCATARNLAIDRLKRVTKTNAVVLNPALTAAEYTDIMALQQIESRELVESILALGEPDSKIITCRYYFGLSTKEIAKVLSIKENTIDQRMRRALKKLKRLTEGGLTNAK